MTGQDRQRWRTIAALFGGVLIYGLAMGTTYPLLGLVQAERVGDFWNGVNAAATGLGLLAGVGSVPRLCRRLGAGGTVLLGIAVMALSLAALAWLRDFWPVFAVRALLGWGANLMLVVTEAALNTLAVPRWRGRVMGLYTAATAVGFVVGPAVVALMPERPGALLLGGAAVTAVCLLPFGWARRRLDRDIAPPDALGILPSIAALPFAFGFLVLAAGTDAVAIALLPVIALAQGYAASEGALFVTLFHVGLLLGQPLVGLALDRLGRRRTVLAFTLVAFGCAAALAQAGAAGFAATAGLMLLWGGSYYALYTAGLALLGDRFAGAALSAATAAFAAVYAVCSIAAPPAAGLAVEAVGAEGFYLAVAGLYLLAALTGALRFRPAEPTLSRAAPRDLSPPSRAS